MRVLVLFALAFVALATAERDRSKIINKDLKIKIPHKPSTRISNGNEAVPHSRPWQVYIPGFLEYETCGGVLIDEQNILTTIPCVYFRGIATVILGAHNITDEDEASRVEVVVTDFEWNLEHNDYSNANNIALIRLPNPVTFNEYIQPIPLDDSSCSVDYVGEEAVMSGWGLDSSVLLEAAGTVMSNERCADYYAARVTPQHICVDTTHGISTCHGDYGGPLDLDGKLIGLSTVPFGYLGQCDAGWPAVFTRVCKFISWIEDNKKK